MREVSGCFVRCIDDDDGEASRGHVARDDGLLEGRQEEERRPAPA